MMKATWKKGVHRDRHGYIIVFFNGLYLFFIYIIVYDIGAGIPGLWGYMGI